MVNRCLFFILFMCVPDSPKTSTYKFCLAMLIFCLFLKVSQLSFALKAVWLTSVELQLAVIYIGAHFFASLGGANSMDASNLTSSSVYEPLGMLTCSAIANMCIVSLICLLYHQLHRWKIAKRRCTIPHRWVTVTALSRTTTPTPRSQVRKSLLFCSSV